MKVPNVCSTQKAPVCPLSVSVLQKADISIVSINLGQFCPFLNIIHGVVHRGFSHVSFFAQRCDFETQPHCYMSQEFVFFLSPLCNMPQFIHSAAEGHWGCSPLVATISSAAEDTIVQELWWM